MESHYVLVDGEWKFQPPASNSFSSVTWYHTKDLPLVEGMPPARKNPGPAPKKPRPLGPQGRWVPDQLRWYIKQNGIIQDDGAWEVELPNGKIIGMIHTSDRSERGE